MTAAIKSTAGMQNKGNSIIMLICLVVNKFPEISVMYMLKCLYPSFNFAPNILYAIACIPSCMNTIVIGMNSEINILLFTNVKSLSELKPDNINPKVNINIERVLNIKEFFCLV